MRILALFASVVLSSACLAAPVPDRPGIFGIGAAGGDWVLGNPAGYDALKFERIAQAGGASTRIGASWPHTEPEPGVYVWDVPDFEVAQCVKWSIEPYFLIVNTPAWASPTGKETHEYPPVEERAPEFEAFLTALATRFRGKVRNYEFWNEENGYGWHTHDGYNHADEYVPWLRRAYRALKAGDPGCKVGLGGLDDAEGNAPIYLNLVYYYRDLWYPGERLFDAVADHPYAESQPVSGVAGKLRNLRNILLSHGDDDVELWLTEYGWNTSNELDKANKLRAYLDLISQPEFHYVVSAQYLAIADFETRYTGYGLSNVQLRPRPAYFTMQEYVKTDAPQISHVTVEPIGEGRARVRWRTHVPATSQVEYGAGEYQWTTPLDAALVTEHAVEIGELVPMQEYVLRARSTATGRPEALSPQYRYRQPGHLTFFNPGFEDGFMAGYPHGWDAVGTAWSLDETVRTHSGGHAAHLVTSGGWGRRMNGTLWTQITMPTGTQYRVQAHTMSTTYPANPDKAPLRRVGTDPTGGTDPDAASVIWSEQLSNYFHWTPQSATATAEVEAVTLFIHGETAAPDSFIFDVYVDDATIEILSLGPTPTPTITPTPSPGRAFLSIH